MSEEIQTTQSIETEEELRKVLEGIPYESEEQRNKIVCALIGHSRIQTTFFGYYYCARCGDQLGDTLGSVYDITDLVVVGHGCDQCKANWESCNWKDKIFVGPPEEEE